MKTSEAWSSTANGTLIRFNTTASGTTTTSTRMIILDDGSVGIGTTAPNDKLEVNGIIRVATLGSANTTTALCRNTSFQIATCNSSSLRYKTDIRPFTGGLEMVNRLRPITFTWKQGGGRDVGFGAEDVAKVEPLFTFTNDKGEIEGVKYDRVSVVLINAVKQQQTSPLPRLTRAQLLAAKRVAERQWQASSESRPLTLLPFTSLGALPYTTYLKVI